MDASKWLAIVGVISALTLGAGLITGLISAGLGWKVNRQQARDLAQISHDKDVQIERVRTEGETRLGIETAKVRQDAQTKIEIETAKLTADADAKIAQARADAQKDVAAARVRQDEIALELRTKAKELAEAQSKADVAHLALKKYLDEVAKQGKNRGFTPEQRARFIEIMRTAPKTPIDISCVSPEACALAGQISSALREAGWPEVLGGDGSVMSILAEPFPGMQVIQRDAGAYLPTITALLTAFETAGVKADARWDETRTVPAGTVKIVIGIKP